MAREVSIIVSAKNMVSAGLGKASASLKKFGESAKKIGASVVSGFKKIGTAVLAAGASIVGLGAYFVKAASDSAEMQSKFDVVFGTLRGSATAFAKDLADATNRGATEIRGFLASLQDLFKPMGMSGEAAAEMSKNLTKLAIDVASFNNVSDKKVIEDFAAAMTGSGEVLKKYGIILTEGKIKQKAYEMGLAEVGDQLNDVQKAQARYQIILESTTDAQGDAERTSGSFANQMKGLKSAFEEARIAVGKQIMETAPLADLLGILSSKVKDLTSKFNAWAESGGIEKTLREIKVWAAETKAKVQEVGAAFGVMAEWVGSNVGAMFGNLLSVAKEKLSQTKKVVENWAYNIGLEFQAAIDPNVSREDIKDLYKTWDEGFGDIEKATSERLRGINELTDNMAKELVIIEEDKNKSISDANEKLTESLKKKAEERQKTVENETAELTQALEEQESAVASLTAENEYLNQSIEDQSAVVSDAMESFKEFGAEFGKFGEIKRFVAYVKELAEGLADLKMPSEGSLKWLKELSGIELSKLSGFQVKKFVKQITELAKGLSNIGQPGSLAWLKDLGDFKLESISGFEVQKFVQNITKLAEGLKDVKIPKIDLSMGVGDMDLKEMTKLAEALSKVKGGNVSLKFEDKVTTAIVENEKNTKSIADTIKKAGGFN